MHKPLASFPIIVSLILPALNCIAEEEPIEEERDLEQNIIIEVTPDGDNPRHFRFEARLMQEQAVRFRYESDRIRSSRRHSFTPLSTIYVTIGEEARIEEGGNSVTVFIDPKTLTLEYRVNFTSEHGKASSEGNIDLGLYRLDDIHDIPQHTYQVDAERDAAIEKFVGTWNVKYLPEGMEVQDFRDGDADLMAELLEYPPTEMDAFRNPVEIEFRNEKLIIPAYGGISYEGDLVSGSNDAIDFHYAYFTHKSEYGFASATLYLHADNRIYGNWHRIFWGRTEANPPLVYNASFVMNRNSEQGVGRNE